MSSTAGSAGGGDDAEQQKTSLFCKKCEEPIALRSAMLLDDGGLYGCSAEWQGVIWGLCLDCSGLSPEQFKRQSKKAWTARAVALGGRVKRYRALTFENLGAMIQKELPGAKNSLIRELSFLRLKCCCLNLAAALDSENEFTLAARDHVNVKYEGAIKAAADNPANGCTMDGQVYSQKELSHLTELAKGFSVSFCCRRSNCLWFGQNHEWPEAKGTTGYKVEYRFACPCCGMPYKPWKPLADCENFQFVLAMPDPINGGQLFLPAMWADSHDEKWLHEQMEVHVLQIQTSGDLEKYTLGEASKELVEYIADLAPPVYFKHEPWVRPAWIEPKYDLSLYEARGTTFGCKLDLVRDAKNIANPFREWAQLAALMGRLVAKAREEGGAALQAVQAAM